MKRAGILAAALAIAMAAGCNKANDRKPSTDTASVGTAGRNASGVSSADRDFVRDIAVMNAADLELGRLASERGTSAEVKQFAQMMVTDHSSAGDKLQTFATQRGIDMPPQLDDKHRDLKEKLAGKQGADFDRDYAEAMVDEHQKLVDKLESRIDKDTITRVHQEVKNGPDADVKAAAIVPEKSDDPNTQAVNQWAADLYPTAYAHLKAAKQLRDGVKKRT